MVFVLLSKRLLDGLCQFAAEQAITVIVTSEKLVSVLAVVAAEGLALDTQNTVCALDFRAIRDIDIPGQTEKPRSLDCDVVHVRLLTLP